MTNSNTLNEFLNSIAIVSLEPRLLYLSCYLYRPKDSSSRNADADLIAIGSICMQYLQLTQLANAHTWQYESVRINAFR